MHLLAALLTAPAASRRRQVLLRRTKNNPVLIGDPGVGKTAVAEGIAQLLVSPAAPPGLRGRSLIALDVGSLVAGTQYRGAFEERLTVGGMRGAATDCAARLGGSTLLRREAEPPDHVPAMALSPHPLFSPCCSRC